MDIYCQYSHLKVLERAKGDGINEINFMRALSKFANVYYSGNLFNPNTPDFGMKTYPQSPVEYMNRKKYDWYYIRANENCFLNTKGKRRIWMSAPFNYKCFVRSTKIATFTEAEAEDLRNGPINHEWIPKELRIPYPQAVNIGQVVSDSFKPYQSNHLTKEIRAQMGGDFIIGHFGRIVDSNYPDALLRSLPALIGAHKGLKVVFGIGKKQKNKLVIPVSLKRHVITMSFKHDQMPYVISACDLIMLSNRGYEWDVCGCTKVLESSACGVPIVMGRSRGREEVLGKDYPLFINPIHSSQRSDRDVPELSSKISECITNKNLMKDVSLKVQKLVLPYTVDQSANRLKKIFEIK